MLTKEELNTLRENLLNSVDKMYPGDDSDLTKAIFIAASHVFVEGIRQYEGMKGQS